MLSLGFSYKVTFFTALVLSQTGLQVRVCNLKIIFLFSIKTYVVGTQKNHLNETVLMSTQNMC